MVGTRLHPEAALPMKVAEVPEAWPESGRNGTRSRGQNGIGKFWVSRCVVEVGVFWRQGKSKERFKMNGRG